MPKVGKKHYPYTKAGKAAAKAAARGLKKGVKNIGKAAVTVAKKSKTAAANKKLKNAGLKLDGRLKKGALKRTPAQLRKQRAGMANAKRKRKAGRGYQK